MWDREKAMAVEGTGARVVFGGVTGRRETMCPCTNVLGPLVPFMNRPGNTSDCFDTSLSFYTNLNDFYNA